MPVDACYKTDLDLRQLKTSSVRNLVTCLNGHDQAIQPYADFLEKSVSDEDLKVLLDIYNKHLVKEARFRKVFDFLDLLNKKGLSDDFYKNLSYLTQTRSLQTLLPILAILYQQEDSGIRPIDSINDYLRVFIEKEEINRALVSIANLIGSGRFRWLSYMGATYLSKYPNSTEAIVDDIADGIFQSIQTNGWQEFLLLATDPVVHPIVLQMLESESGISKYGLFLKELFKKNQNTTHFESLLRLSRAAAAPTACWEEQAYSENLFGHIFDKLSTYTEPRDFEQEILQKIPAMYFLGRNACRFNSEITNNLHTPILLARDGFTYAMHSTIATFAAKDREEYMKRLLTSVNIKSMNSILENFTHNDLIYYFLETLQKDITKEDFSSFHRIIRNMFIEDLATQDLVRWLENSRLSYTSKKHIEMTARQNKLGLHATMDYLLADASSRTSYQTYAELILYLSQIEMPNAPGSKLQTMMLKLFGPNYVFRQNLKEFANTYVRSLENKNAGWGDLIASVGEAIVQTGEDPFVDFIKDLISDTDFVNAMNPILAKYFKDPLFMRAVAFTGELAENGELRRLANFFIQIAKSIEVPGLSIYPSPYVYKKYRGSLEVFKKDYKFSVARTSDYSSCWNLTISNSSDLWLDFMSCINANGSYPNVITAVESLQQVTYRQQTLYQALTHFIDRILESPSTYKFVNALNEFSSWLKQIHRIVLEGLQKHPILQFLNAIFSQISLQPEFTHLLQVSGNILSLDGISTVIKEVVSLYDQEKESYYQVPKEYKSVLADPQTLFRLASSWKNDLDYSELPVGMSKNIENLWGYASSNYIARNDTYLFQSEIYKAPPQDTENIFYQEELLQFLIYQLRPENLEALIGAFQDLQNEKFNFIGVLQWMVHEQSVIKYYVGTNKKPTIRLVNPADKLEILVQNAQIGVAAWAGGMGADHIATMFQYEIATTNNLKSTLKDLKSKIATGINYATITSNQKKLNHLKNIEQTFSVLEEMQEKGYLRFLQVIYKRLLDVTPQQYKKKQDPVLNHMGLAHYLARLGLFARLVHGVEILQEQNKLEAFVSSFENLLRSIKPADIAVLRRSTELLVANEGALFKNIFSRYWQQVTLNPQSVFAQNLLNVIGLLPPAPLAVTNLVSAAESALKNATFADFMIEKILDSFANRESVAPKLLNTLHYVESRELRDSVLREVLFSTTAIGVDLVSLLEIAHRNSKRELELLYVHWLQLLQDPSMDFRQLRASAIPILQKEEQEPRLLVFLAEIVSEAENRDLVAHVIYNLAQNRQLDAVVLEYLQFMSVGDFESIISYLQAFKPSNSRVQNF